MRPDNVWYGDDASARAARLALLPLSWLYALSWNAYLALYRLGLKRPKEPHRPVVCVGSLAVGGSGKTPLALHVADVARALGHSVVLSCSGYGSPAATGAALAPDGPLKAVQWGDEPAMIRWLRPDLPLIVGRDRVRAAELCHSRFPDAALILDDGFQHLPLAKHATLVVHDPDAPNKACLPAGPYREPRSGLRRAHWVLPDGFRVVQSKLAFEIPEGLPVDPAEYRGAPANVLCALGSPRKFIESVVAAGVEIEHAKLLPDHDPLDEGNLWDHFDASLPVVVTAKDWVKLRERPDLVGRTIWIARHELRVEPAPEFRDGLRRLLEAFV